MEQESRQKQKLHKIIVGSVLGVLAIGGVAVAGANIASQPHDEPVASVSSAAETKTEATKTIEEQETVAVPYETTHQDDHTLAKGTTKIIQEGEDGEAVKHYTVTYRDGVEVERTLIRTETIKEPTNKIVAEGTYVAPASAKTDQTTAGNTTANNTTNSATPAPAPSNNATPSPSNSGSTSSSSNTSNCPNGSYVNSAGNRVCSPSASLHPEGATALCKDGTYSMSQNRSGTCSHHGGVQAWL